MKKRLFIFLTLILAFMYSFESQSQNAYLGELRLFPYNSVPNGWLECNGQVLQISSYNDLYNVIGTTYGGNGVSTFALPDLRGRTPIHPGYGGGYFSLDLGDKGGSESEYMLIEQLPSHNHTITNKFPCYNGNGTTTSPGYYAVNSARGNEFSTMYNASSPSTYFSTTVSGSGLQARNNMQPYIAMVWCISIYHVNHNGMMGEIRLIAGNSTPANWNFCSGQLLSIAQNSGLFSCLGTTYGGNGPHNFALPDLRARVVVGTGQGPSTSNYVLGQWGGSPTISYLITNLPSHTHSFTIKSSLDAATKDDPAGNFPATQTSNAYSAASNADMRTNSLSVTVNNAGGSQAQNNVQPYLGINHMIATTGTYFNTSECNPLVGEIKLIAATPQIPSGWLPCDGSSLLISEHLALFSLIGTTYGGDGITTFALPDLRGRVPIGRSTTYSLGQTGGTETETIDITKMPAHVHSGSVALQVYSGIGNSNTPVNSYPAINPHRGFEFTSTITTSSDLYSITTDATGGGEPVDNRQPYIPIQYIICTNGIYPSFP